MNDFPIGHAHSVFLRQQRLQCNALKRAIQLPYGKFSIATNADPRIGSTICSSSNTTNRRLESNLQGKVSLRKVLCFQFDSQPLNFTEDYFHGNGLNRMVEEE